MNNKIFILIISAISSQFCLKSADLEQRIRACLHGERTVERVVPAAARKVSVAVEPESDVCAICQSDILPTEKTKIGACEGKHKFHKDCIDRWLRENNECPTCRAFFGEKGIAEARAIAHNLQSDLMSAIQSNDETEVIRLLDLGANPGRSVAIGANEERRTTPLIFAIQKGGRTKLIPHLIAHADRVALEMRVAGDLDAYRAAAQRADSSTLRLLAERELYLKEQGLWFN